MSLRCDERVAEEPRIQIEKRNRDVEVFVLSCGFEKVKDEGRQTERRKVCDKGSAPALLEENVEADD